MAAVCKNLHLPCEVFYGGTNLNSAMKHHMVRLANFYGAQINLQSKSGRHSVLKHAIKQIITPNDFIVEYGINLNYFQDALLLSTASQVKNIPENLNNLVITCGSGITAAGVMLGIKKYNKKINNIILITTAPDRTKTIENVLNQYNYSINYKIIDLFHMPNFKYEKKENFIFDNIKLHPNYEAKTLKCFLESDYSKENSLFWIVGTYPELDLL